MTAQDHSAEREALPPLPAPIGTLYDDPCWPCAVYSADQMREYARAALSAREAPAPDADKASLWLSNVRDEFRKLAEEANKIMRGHIALLNAAPTQEGWQLVPKEPTYEMLKAGDDEADPPRTATASRIPLQAMYRAMLAAAPQAPTTEGSAK